MTKAVALTNNGGPPATTSGKPAAAGSHTHAALEVYDAVWAKGGSKLAGKTETLEFQFNPKEITITKSAKWERKPAKGAKQAGPPEFTGSEPCKLTMEMFFDATLDQKTDVVQSVETLLRCCVPTDKSLPTKKPMPSLVALKWGGISSFAAFVTQVSAKYTLFAANGTPLRAVCTVNLEEMPGERPAQNPTSGALAETRVHRMVAGDSLALLAFQEYGDAALWRRLAAYNGFDDPAQVPDGTAVVLPSPEDLLTKAG